MMMTLPTATEAGNNNAPSQKAPLPLVHNSVMAAEVAAIAHRQLARGGGGAAPIRCVDATFGAGGYSDCLLRELGAGAQILAIDRDPSSITQGRQVFAGAPVHFANTDFAHMRAALTQVHWQRCDLVVFDFGISSLQLDDPKRGFSFRADGPLDMRMGTEGITAAHLVNTLPHNHLADLLFYFGEERRSRTIAAALVAARRRQPITTTAALREIISGVLGASRGTIHPATRTFMALRIAVNDELHQIGRGLLAAAHCLSEGGVLIAVTFHSLEDRIVKRFFRRMAIRKATGKAARMERWQGNQSAQPTGDTSAANNALRLIADKPQTPSRKEIMENPRARSAKLRWAVRTDFPLEQDYPPGAASPQLMREIAAFSLSDVVSTKHR